MVTLVDVENGIGFPESVATTTSVYVMFFTASLIGKAKRLRIVPSESMEKLKLA